MFVKASGYSYTYGIKINLKSRYVIVCKDVTISQKALRMLLISSRRLAKTPNKNLVPMKILFSME